MTTADIFLIVIFVVAIVVGFFWGAVRSIMLLAAWLGAFLAGAYLRIQGGSWLSQQWTNFDPLFNEMAAFGLVYFGLLLAAPILIVVGTRGEQRVTRYPLLDDGAAALFAGVAVALGVAGLLIVLGSYYELPEASATGGPDWTYTLYTSLLSSRIGQAIDENLVPLVTNVLGPILPATLREAIT
jgi:hypothetical protein